MIVRSPTGRPWEYLLLTSKWFKYHKTSGVLESVNAGITSRNEVVVDSFADSRPLTGREKITRSIPFRL